MGLEKAHTVCMCVCACLCLCAPERFQRECQLRASECGCEKMFVRVYVGGREQDTRATRCIKHAVTPGNKHTANS